MEAYESALSRSVLFEGIAPEQRRALLECLKPRRLSFGRGDILLAEDGPADRVGVLLSGEARVVRGDVCGNRTIQARVEPGELFAEAFACAGVARLPVSVEGEQPGEALLIPMTRLVEPCGKVCGFHRQVTVNLLRATASRNLQLNRKLEILSRRTTREKLMTYLTAEAARARSATFMIPFDRQGLADYLGVDRSALSAEIGKLRREGVLESERSSFKLLNVKQSWKTRKE